MNTASMIPIEKGALPTNCPRGCGAFVYWVERPRASGVGTVRIPVDADVSGGVEPDSFSQGRGVNHFSVCTADESV